jgi:hypothetical protein
MRIGLDVVGKSSFGLVASYHARFFANRYQLFFGIVGFDLSMLLPK